MAPAPLVVTPTLAAPDPSIFPPPSALRPIASSLVVVTVVIVATSPTAVPPSVIVDGVPDSESTPDA